MSKNPVLYKSLVVGVIILFVGIGIQPAFAVVQNEIIGKTMVNPDETWYLANFTMDFGENITNDIIDYEEKGRIPEGDYTINVKLNFRCPENIKIVVKYEYYAEVYDLVTLYPIFFCDAKETVTIINGSNPPDIDIDYTEFCPMHARNQWLLVLRIKANLTAYEFIYGEWVKLHNDDTLEEIKDSLVFNRIRPSDGSHILMKLFDRLPILGRLLFLLL